MRPRATLRVILPKLLISGTSAGGAPRRTDLTAGRHFLRGRREHVGIHEQAWHETVKRKQKIGWGFLALGFVLTVILGLYADSYTLELLFAPIMVLVCRGLLWSLRMNE